VSVRARSFATAAAAAALVSVSVLTPGAAGASSSSPLPAGYLYTTTNSADGNKVVQYRRVGSDLQLVRSYSTGGDGTGLRPPGVLGPPDVDQSLVIDRAKRLLFTVNEGSDSIAVFRIGDGGRLTPVYGSPFDSGGENPVSIGISGNRLYVVNKDDDPPLFGGLNGDPVYGRHPNYTGFRIGSDGFLTPIPNSTVEAPAGSSPTQALISPNGRFLFGSDFFGRPGQADGSRLHSFVIGSTGRLTDAPGSPFSSNQDVALPHGTDPGDVPGTLGNFFGNLVVGLQVHPTAPYVYVGQPVNSFIGGAQHLGVYRYDKTTGRLTYVRSVPALGLALCWLVISPDGRWMFTTNTVDGSVSAFDLANPAKPVQVAFTRLTDHSGLPFGGTAPGQLALSGNRLYITSTQESTGVLSDTGLYVVRIDRNSAGQVTGLTEVRNVDPQLGGTTFEPLGVAIT
jgi:6-phosphogluconolactonase (cycloisomerase 2 family)